MCEVAGVEGGPGEDSPGMATLDGAGQQTSYFRVRDVEGLILKPKVKRRL